MRAAVVLLVAGCGSASGGGQQWPIETFLLPDGMQLAHAPLGEPEGPVTWLGARGDTWVLSDGDDLDDAVERETWSVDRSDGLSIDGEPLLPLLLETGEGGVVALGEHETWYGTFPRAATVEIASGRWAGTQCSRRASAPSPLRSTARSGISCSTRAPPSSHG